MSLEKITNHITAQVGEDSGLGATLKFNMGDDGVVFVDTVTVPNSVSNDDTDADCTISISMDDMNSVIEGDLDPMTAFMMGKLKVEGNMSIAMKLQSVLS